MDIYQPDRRQRGRARERNAARQRKQMAVRRNPVTTSGDPGEEALIPERPVMSRSPYEPGKYDTEVLKGRALIMLRDAAWYLRRNRLLLVGIALLPFVLFAIYYGAHVFGNRILPNVWVMGRDIGGMNADEASLMLSRSWAQETRLSLVDGTRSWTVTPSQLGLQLDAAATVEHAKAVGMSGVPFGYGITPVVTLDYLTAQNYLLDLSDQSKLLPRNASFQWQNDLLVGVQGTDGRFLDIAATMGLLENSLSNLAETRSFDLVMTAMPPDTRDPEPYLAQAQAFASHSFVIRGFDPFEDEHFAWSTDRDTLTSWLEVGEEGLTLRQETFANFVNAQTVSLQATNSVRYIEPNDSIEKMQQAIDQNLSEMTVRVRYRPFEYTVVSGDTAWNIARKNGVSFFQLEAVNPGRDLAVLNVDDTVNIPSLDLMIPLDPLPNKRIVVNIRTQTLAAFENGELVRTWSVATGMDRAPTSPGVYQVLNHDPLAAGGSYELCSDMGCAQWEMYWFMGIYEVTPGLVNGFHGWVELPNGGLLGDGNVGSPATFGCVMSEQEPAKWLYDWAADGTVVEIISGDYPPRSALAEQIWNNGARAQSPNRSETM